MKSSNSSQSELHAELAKIRSEIKSLRDSVESVKQELASFIEAHDVLPSVPSTGYATEPAVDRAEKWCNTYVDLIQDIDMVREVRLGETGQVATIWTIIDDPPAEGSPLKLTYDENLHTLEILKYNMPVDLQILNVSEVTEEKQPLQAETKLIWQR